MKMSEVPKEGVQNKKLRNFGDRCVGAILFPKKKVWTKSFVVG